MKRRGRPACPDCRKLEEQIARGERPGFRNKKDGERVRCSGCIAKNTLKTAKNRYRNGFPTVRMMKEELIADAALPEPTPGDFGMSVEDWKIARDIVRSMGGDLVVVRVREESQAGRVLASSIGRRVTLSTEVNEIGRVRLRAKSD
jgi:hypothetical protein